MAGRKAGVTLQNGQSRNLSWSSVFFVTPKCRVQTAPQDLNPTAETSQIPSGAP
jgi:hypothetical protein